jgi:hypothetical protein
MEKWKKSLKNATLARADGKVVLSNLRSHTLMDSIMLAPPTMTSAKDFEEIDIMVEIGTAAVEKKMQLDSPIFVCQPPYKPVRPLSQSMQLGASIAGTFADMGEELTIEHDNAKNLAYWTPDRNSVSSLFNAHAIKFQLNKFKSPRTHLDVENAADIKKHVELLREATKYQVPIIMEFSTRDVYGDIMMAAEFEVDAVMLTDFGEHPFGMGGNASPNLALFAQARKAMKDCNASKKGMKLLMAGDFRSSVDVFKAICLGADMVGMVYPPLVIMGCETCEECSEEGCISGIFNASKHTKKLAWKPGGERVGAYLNSTAEELKQLISMSGHESVAELSDEDIRALTYDVASVTGITMAGYEKPLPIWMH